MKRALAWVVVAACSDGVAASGDGGGMDDADTAPADSGPTELAIAAEGISIVQIAEFQGVKIPLMNNGALPASKRAYAVAGKPSLLRVYIKHDAAWQTRALDAILDVTAGGMTTTLKSAVPDVAASTDDALGSTINFDLPIELMATDAEYSVRILEKDKFAWPTSDAMNARWPVDGTMTTLDTKSSGPSLKLTLVPIRYNGDASGRLPDTSMTQLDRYKNLLYDTYPTPAIDLVIHAPVDWASPVAANGTGWGSLLSFIANLRQQESTGNNRYYYGIFAPAASFGAYCSSGCIEGLALVGAQPTDNYSRAAVGLGFTGNTVAQVLLQELAHNMGRLHAPCGNPANTDPAYPYPGGLIGSWGYSLTFKSLRPPTMLRDFMSYCQPQWVSDYTYRGLFDRLKFVNNASFSVGPSHNWRWATFDGETLTYGARFVGTTPGGEMKTIGGVTGHFYPFDHAPGGLLIVPDG